VDKSELKEKGWLKASDLAERAGVSVSTIHYYVQEGLLTPPARTARNMAYYDPACIREIKTIQELQSIRFMPLSAIKLLIHAEREGQGPAHLGEMRTFFEQIFHPLTEKATQASLSFDELVNASGLEPSIMRELEEDRLIVSRPTEQGVVYDDIDLNVARIAKKLAGFGVAPSDLSFYRQYVDFLRIEAKTWHEMFHARTDHEDISLIDFFQTVNELKEGLAVRAYRQETRHFHPGSIMDKTMRLNENRENTGEKQ
jgi:DNA-binding transcriptional MerR regulator